jgi:glycosyltransferase involved in cell wall biosynthesis
MKILFVNSSKMWGGGEKWHLETANAMRDKGFEVAILALHRKELFKRAVSSGIRAIPVHVSNCSFLNPFNLVKLISLFRKENPDVVLLNFSADIKTVGIAAKFAGIKNIVYRRGSAIPIRDTLINRILYTQVITRIIANSKATMHTILQHNKTLFPAEKISIIYNGIDLEKFDCMPAITYYSRKHDEVIIGNAGRLVIQKGQKYLIDIASFLHKKNINFKMLIAGEGPLEISLKQMAATAGIENRMIFLGFINNIKAFMENIDIFVLPSLWEGFGYVLLEAMACNKPVVAFNISSNPEIIIHNETGYLIDNLDIAAFTGKIELLINNPAIRESFGKAGRKRVKETFDIAKTEENLEKFLAGL